MIKLKVTKRNDKNQTNQIIERRMLPLSHQPLYLIVEGDDEGWSGGRGWAGVVSSAHFHHLYAGFDIVTVRVVHQVCQRDEGMVQSLPRSDTTLLQSQQHNTLPQVTQLHNIIRHLAVRCILRH